MYKEYEIICKNRLNEQKLTLSLEFEEVKFTELYKSDNISVSENGKVIKEKMITLSIVVIIKCENGKWNLSY